MLDEEAVYLGLVSTDLDAYLGFFKSKIQEAIHRQK